MLSLFSPPLLARAAARRSTRRRRPRPRAQPHRIGAARPLRASASLLHRRGAFYSSSLLRRTATNNTRGPKRAYKSRPPPHTRTAPRCPRPLAVHAPLGDHTHVPTPVPRPPPAAPLVPPTRRAPAPCRTSGKHTRSRQRCAVVRWSLVAVGSELYAAGHICRRGLGRRSRWADRLLHVVAVDGDGDCSNADKRAHDRADEDAD